MATKSERTRARLQQVAVELFGERGFDHVTVAEIARAAGVSEVTFFRYFAAKEQVLLDDPYDALIAAGVAQQDRARPALERTVRGLRQSWSAINEREQEFLRRRLRIGVASPRVRAGIGANNAVTERAIADALVESGTPRLEAVVAAAAALGALTAALLDWASCDDGGDLGQHITTALDVLEGAGTE